RLMPAFTGPGARRPSIKPQKKGGRAPGPRAGGNRAGGNRAGGNADDEPWQWVGKDDSSSSPAGGSVDGTEDQHGGKAGARNRLGLRSRGNPMPAVANDGTPVMRYGFAVDGTGSPVRLGVS